MFVRKNAYEAGRANVTIYNWRRQASVAVDLAGIGLATGQAFEIRDAQNFFGQPIVRGTYTGTPVQIPVENLRAAPLAGCAQIEHIVCDGTSTGPGFGAFVVMPGTTTPSSGPVTSAQGIVSSADYSQRIAPGAIVAMFGDKLAASSVNAGTLPLPTSLGGTTVTLTDAAGRAVSAPLFFVSGQQINLQWPFELALGPVQVAVINTAGTARATVTSIAQAPAIYTQDSRGTGADSFILVRNSQVVAKTNPARSGDFVSAYMTGLGLSSPASVTGQVPSGLSNVAPTRVLLRRPDGAAPIAVVAVFAGKAPGMVGVDQVNFQVPADFWGGSTLGAGGHVIGVQICSGANFSACSKEVTTFIEK